jgi:hypothetical protein
MTESAGITSTATHGCFVVAHVAVALTPVFAAIQGTLPQSQHITRSTEGGGLSVIRAFSSSDKSLGENTPNSRWFNFREMSLLCLHQFTCRTF